MSEPVKNSLEERSRALFHDSVENLDMRVRSRLTQARHAALEATSTRRRVRAVWWAPAAGVTAAAVIGVALFVGAPGHHSQVPSTDGQSIEDLELLATDNGGETMEMLQDDPDFYDFADKAAETEPAA